jgi:hypothetical protein
MTIKTETLDTIRLLLNNANSIGNFHDLFNRLYSSDSNCDKKGFGFNKDNRFSAFTLSVTFDSWKGYYGSSSCYSVLQCNDKVKQYFVKALNLHQKELFATAARLMREDAALLTDEATAEINELQRLLDEVKGEKSK